MSQSLGLVLEQACRRFGDAPGLQAPGLAWSHAALAQQAQAVAAQLRAAGLRADEPVLVHFGHGDVACSVVTAGAPA